MFNKKLSSMIPHIGIFGNTNVGKSSFINALVNQNVSLVSEVAGTTTDAVRKRMEVLDLGPVVIIDTAGFGDDSTLGSERIERTLKELNKIDLAIILFEKSEDEVVDIIKEVSLKGINYVLIQNKIDLNMSLDGYLGVSSTNNQGFDKVLEMIKTNFKNFFDKPLISDLFKGKKKVKIVHVMPIDSEAPAGRIILPQMRVLRECLDNNYISIVIQVEELEQVVKTNNDIDLVITDSQAFNEVSKLVPNNIDLTSYSIIFARNKGDLNTFISGAKTIDKLNKDSKILISEACSHNVSHEDIGQVKIPNMIEKIIGSKPTIEHYMGSDYPSNVKDYDLIIHCGACMINEAAMTSRLNKAVDNNIPITNYGIFIASFTGILERAIKPFSRGDK